MLRLSILTKVEQSCSLLTSPEIVFGWKVLHVNRDAATVRLSKMSTTE